MTIYIPSTNYFNESRFIVDPTAGEGRFTTIQAAINAATAGETVFIRPGTYTENITLKDGVNLTAFTRDVNIVQINGTITMNTAGTVNISGITVQTNGATAVSFSSANIQSLRFFNCNLTSTNADLITSSNSSASSSLVFENCTMTAAATYKIFVATMTGVLNCINCSLGGASTTAWTSTAGNIVFRFCSISQVFSISSTATVQIYNCIIGTNNLLFGTLATGTNCIAFNSRISTGTASIFSITSTGSVTVENCILQSSNASTVTGTGSFFDALNTYEATRNPATTTVVLNNNSLCDGNGTSGQVLKSNGANALPTWATASSVGGSLVLIQTQTANNSANISFTTGITSTYSNYIIFISNIRLATLASNLRMTFSTNGGVSYLATNYESGTSRMQYNAVAPTANVNSTTFSPITDNANNTGSGAFTITLAEVNTGNPIRHYGIGNYPTNGFNTMYFNTGQNTATNVDAIRFASSSGNLTSGVFSLYGVSK